MNVGIVRMLVPPAPAIGWRIGRVRARPAKGPSRNSEVSAQLSAPWSQEGLDVQKLRMKNQTFCTEFLHDGSPVRLLPRLHLGSGLVPSAGGPDQGWRGRPRHLPRDGVRSQTGSQ